MLLNLKLIFARRKVKNSWPSGRGIFNQCVNSQKGGFLWIPGRDSGSPRIWWRNSKYTAAVWVWGSGAAGPARPTRALWPVQHLRFISPPQSCLVSKVVMWHYSHGPTPWPPTASRKRASGEWQWNETAVRTNRRVEDGITIRRRMPQISGLRLLSDVVGLR